MLWTDRDEAGLRWYLQARWKFRSENDLRNALELALHANAYHPVREYLRGLVWDGTPRLDTMLVDYLGAEDTPYTRAATRKWMCGAVKRVMVPGCKFDSAIVLVGKQGIGKSSFAGILSRGWFNDSEINMNSKDGYESLHGNWIIELAELASTKRSDVETVKTFLSKCEDTYRPAYGRRATTFKRQCVFFGTTNEEEFLRDRTGNRRFWPVTCTANSPHRPWEVESVVPQLWAEAWQLYKNGEKLFLTPKEEKQAEMEQTAALESDVREGMIAEYLNTLLPEDWDKMDLAERRGFLRGDQFTGGNRTGTIQRTTVCAVEIWAECFGKDPSTIKRSDTYDIFGMLMKIGGWEKYSGNKTGVIRRPPYGPQRCYVKVKC